MPKTRWMPWTDVCWMDVSYVCRWRVTEGRRPLTAGRDAPAAAVHDPVRALAAVPEAVLAPAAAGPVQGPVHGRPARAPVARPRADLVPAPGLPTTVARVPSRLR